MNTETQKIGLQIEAALVGVVPSLETRCAILGNLAWESGGFLHMHEIGQAPSQGGINIAQWTGPRRHLFETYCSEHGLDATSIDGGIAYLKFELEGAYRKSLVYTGSLYFRTAWFETHYEIAGVPAIPQRYALAEKFYALLSAPVA